MYQALYNEDQISSFVSNLAVPLTLILFLRYESEKGGRYDTYELRLPIEFGSRCFGNFPSISLLFL